jgi:pimeloyl-ACP methyl ester carboxylesterase
MALRSYLDGSMFAERSSGDDGRPMVVALHGWRRDRHDLEPLLAGREAISFDLPGFGASPPPSEVWGAADYAAHVAAALDATSPGVPVTVVGHSFGGRVGVHLAAARPDLVGALVLCGVPLLRLTPAYRPSTRYRLVRWGNEHRIVPDSVMERLRRSGGSADYNAATGIMRDVFVKVVNETYEPQLRATRCPVGFIWGARDREATVAVAEAAKVMVPTLASFTVVDAGHDVHRERPDAILATIDAVEAYG